MMNSLGSIRSYERAMREIHNMDNIQRMSSITDNTMSMQMALNSIKLSDSMQSMIRAMDYTKSIQNAISSLNYNDSIHRMMESMRHTTAMQPALDSMKLNDSVQSMIRTMDYAKTVQKAISSLNYNDSFHQMMESMKHANTLNILSKSIDVSNYMQSVGAYMARPIILEQIVESTRSWKGFDPDHFEMTQDAFSQLVTPLSKAEDDKTFVSSFLKIPPVMQAVIFFIFLHIFLPQVNNITSNILTPYVQEIIITPNKTNKKLVKEIKKIPAASFGIDISTLRFITGTNVRLRQKPSTNSQILDELDIGQVVEVVGKKKNWIKIKVIYDDAYLIGWVFTRYTAKFKGEHTSGVRSPFFSKNLKPGDATP